MGQERASHVRQQAVELLKLQEGDRVLDIGCGLGGSFPYLVHAVGPSGQVVGVEISPVISVNARNRIETNGPDRALRGTQ
jgi:demethylmenaquinone methyltransferase/2-methoxy-6-polyprenyl-1,4-benzoquinol methylase